MSRLESQLGKFSGKLGDHVFVAGKRGKNYVRKAIRGGSKKHEPALKAQYNRTAFLNKVAGDMNDLFAHYYRLFKGGNAYQRMLSRMRQVPTDDIILLLNALRNFDLNSRYPLDRMCIPNWSLKAGRTKFEIEIVSRAHAFLQEKNFDEYFYELMMVQWNDTDEDPTVSRQQSEWAHPFETLPAFDFTFPRYPGTTRWMFLMRIMMGKFKEAANSSIHEGVRVMEVGSFLPAEKALLANVRKPKSPDPPSLIIHPEIITVKRKN